MHTWDWEAAAAGCRSGRVGAKGRRAAAGGGGVDMRGDKEVRVEIKKTAEKSQMGSAFDFLEVKYYELLEMNFFFLLKPF